jgi:hypothetical protein
MAFRSNFSWAAKYTFSVAFIPALVGIPIAILTGQTSNLTFENAGRDVPLLIALLTVCALVTAAILALVRPMSWARQWWGTMAVGSIISLPITLMVLVALAPSSDAMWSGAPFLFLVGALILGPLLGLAAWFGEVRPNSPGAKLRRGTR